MSRREHLDDARIQEWLDSRLSARERADVQAHLEACSACRSEVEAWSTLMADLSSLPSLAPTNPLSERVMATVRARPAPSSRSWAARVRAWLRGELGRGAAIPAADHPDAGLLQDLLTGALAGAGAARVRAHVEACAHCDAQARAWGGLLGRLDALPRMAPSEGFADRVMARVRNEATARTPARVGTLTALGRRAVAGVRAAVGAASGPRRTWAAAAGVAFTPATVVALLAYTVFSHPLVTFANLSEFVWLKRGSVTGALTSGLTQNTAVFGAWSWVDAMTRSPSAAATGLLVFTALTGAAAWVLYRNVISPSARPVYARSRD